MILVGRQLDKWRGCYAEFFSAIAAEAVFEPQKRVAEAVFFSDVAINRAAFFASVEVCQEVKFGVFGES